MGTRCAVKHSSSCASSCVWVWVEGTEKASDKIVLFLCSATGWRTRRGSSNTEVHDWENDLWDIYWYSTGGGARTAVPTGPLSASGGGGGGGVQWGGWRTGSFFAPHAWGGGWWRRRLVAYCARVGERCRLETAAGGQGMGCLTVVFVLAVPVVFGRYLRLPEALLVEVDQRLAEVLPGALTVQEVALVRVDLRPTIQNTFEWKIVESPFMRWTRFKCSLHFEMLTLLHSTCHRTLCIHTLCIW